MAALIALSEGDEQLAEKAVCRMERYRDSDMNSPSFGLFGQKEDTVYAYDELIPLLVYMKREMQ